MAGERSSTSTSTVQMTTARYAGDRSREVDAAMIEHHRDEWPQLACVTERCDCLVHAVHKAPTETTAGRSAHFARNATSVHADCCHLGTTRQVEILEKMSGGELKAVGKHRDPLRGDVFLHRIPVPAAFDETPEQRPGQPPEVTPLTFARQIVPILNTAVKIAKLYQRYSDSDVDPHMEFQAECSGQPVEWPNFFYTRNRAIWFARRIRTAQKAHTKLDPNMSPAQHRVSPLTHPVAVMFHIDRAPVESQYGKGEGWARGRLPVPADHDVPDEWVFIEGPLERLKTMFADAGTVRDSLYLGFGMWTVSKPTPRYPFGRLTLDVSAHHTSVCPISGDITKRVRSHWAAGRCDPETPVIRRELDQSP